MRVDERYLNHLRFADDIVLISESAEELQEMLKEIENESKKIGLKMNLSETKVTTDPILNIEIDGNKIGKVNDSTYLGHTIT